MAVVLPFTALRPPPELAERVAAPPYDVMDVAEARAMADGNEHSFLHVSRPEIDLLETVDPHADEVYEQGRLNLEAFAKQGWLCADATPSYSVYRQRMGQHVQTGVVGVAAVDDYESGVIAKHEHTRPDKELDRVRHIDALGAQDEPVFLLYDREPAIQAVVDRIVAAPADVHFRSDDGIEHTLWVVADADDIERLRAGFADVPRLYIADGHHRSAAAARVRELRRARAGAAGWQARAAGADGDSEARARAHDRGRRRHGEGSPYPEGSQLRDGVAPRTQHPRNGQQAHDGFLVVAFAGDELQVLPYHRVVCDLGEVTVEKLLAGLRQHFEVIPAGGPPEPSMRHVIGMHLPESDAGAARDGGSAGAVAQPAAGQAGTEAWSGTGESGTGRRHGLTGGADATKAVLSERDRGPGGWYRLELLPGIVDEHDSVARLDVSVLQDLVLAPLLGIEDPRTDPRLRFVGGIRGTAELERLVESGEAAVAFAMHPTSVGDLQALSDAGLIMPPKSTWFEPKLRSGLFVHPLDT